MGLRVISSGPPPFTNPRARRSSICGPMMTTTADVGLGFKEGQPTPAAPPAQGQGPASNPSAPVQVQPANIGKITFHRNAIPTTTGQTPVTIGRGSTNNSNSETSSHQRRPSDSGIVQTQKSNPRTRQRSASVGGASIRRTSSVDTRSPNPEGAQVVDKKGSGTTDTNNDTTGGRFSQAFTSIGKRPSRFGKRSSDIVVRPPVLETIVGSPPDSPPTQGAAATLTSIQTQLQTGSGGMVGGGVTRGGVSLDGVVGRAFAEIGGLVKGVSGPASAGSVSVQMGTSLPGSAQVETKRFPRIDDEEANVEASRIEALQRMTLSTASASLRESIHAPSDKKSVSSVG